MQQMILRRGYEASAPPSFLTSDPFGRLLEPVLGGVRVVDCELGPKGGLAIAISVSFRGLRDKEKMKFAGL